MKLARPLAASGVALAAVAATLGAVAPAQAAGISAAYQCVFPVVGPQTVTLTVNGALPTTAAAGIPVAAGLLHLPVTATTDISVGLALAGIQANGAEVKDFASTIGNVQVKVPAKFGAPTPSDASHIQFSGEGINEFFQQPAAGTYAITLPKSFTITPTKDGAPIPGVTAPCTTATPVSLGSIKVDKQLGHVSAKASKKAVKKKKAKLVVSVANDWSAKGGVQVGGTVVVKKGKKVVGRATVVNGKATVKLKKLKKGVNKVKVSYLGDAYTGAAKSAKAYKVKVK
ncbi:Ig-like domain (group 3) [Nocardioides terrae]|uniref:Ig-like domain (Group 3) n=1 Tax=Nocardioides terrae TaxID=574651 RepID=A0A1I1FQ12_9ACTN|nr:DUF6801 domain-containing protein [Nocardioides terrae]SFC01649.1 Ig-like domain (group 3) [Nocardioides terrae]